MEVADLLEILWENKPLNTADLWRDLQGPRIETRPEQILFAEDEPPTDAFFVLEGRCHLESQRSSAPILLRLSGPALVGDACAFLPSSVYGYQARCVDACRVIAIPMELLRAQCKGDAMPATWALDVGKRYARTLATATFERFTVEQRLAWWLHELGSSSVPLPPDVSLAQDLGLSADRIARARRKIVDDGSLHIDNGTFRLELQGIEAFPFQEIGLCHRWDAGA